jgi:hypothetical protein
MEDCRNLWTTAIARLKPDGEEVGRISNENSVCVPAFDRLAIPPVEAPVAEITREIYRHPI